jgi:hypothetical protein
MKVRVVNIFAFSVFTCAKKFVVVVIGVDIAETYHFDFCLFFPLIYTVTGEPPLPSGCEDNAVIPYGILSSIHPSIASPRRERIVQTLGAKICVKVMNQVHRVMN